MAVSTSRDRYAVSPFHHLLSVDLATQADTMTAIPWLLCHSEDPMLLNRLLALLLAAVADNSRMDQLGVGNIGMSSYMCNTI